MYKTNSPPKRHRLVMNLNHNVLTFKNLEDHASTKTSRTTSQDAAQITFTKIGPTNRVP